MKALVIALIATFCISVVQAHGGRTDKNGGHTDSKTGRYHKH